MEINAVVIRPNFKGRLNNTIDSVADKKAMATCFLVFKVGTTSAMKLNGTAKSSEKDVGTIFPKKQPTRTLEFQKRSMQIEAPK